MGKLKYQDGNGNLKPITYKGADTLPINTIVDYDGSTVPDGWEEVDDPNVYSTDETVVGTWIDGKPLYRKVIITNLSDTVNVETRTNFNSNIRDIIKIDGYIRLSDSSNVPLNFYVSSTEYIVTYSDFTSGNGRIRTVNNSSKYTGKEVKYIVEYTKTTD